MTREVDNFYLNQEEPNQSCFLALRRILHEHDSLITDSMRYSMPCFRFKNKAFCYLWTDKKTNEPYLLFVEGKQLNYPELESGDRSRMKILRVNPNADLQIHLIKSIIKSAVDFIRH